MRKGFVLLFLTLLIPRLVWSQYYITLNKHNTFHYKNSYIIDIPIKDNVNNLFIQDPQRIIPLETYFASDTIFISNGIQTGKKGLRRKALQSTSVFLHSHQRYNTVDTLKIIDNRFLSYKQISQWRTTLKKDSLLIYYTESADHMGFRYPLFDFIMDFEKKHNVKIGDIFYINHTDVGMGDAYLTLSGLTPTEKLQFIDGRDSSLNPNHPRDMMPRAYSPKLFALSFLHPTQKVKTKAELLKEQDEIVYNAVEVEPKPTQGMNAFLTLFKKIDFGGSAVLYVTFIVNKDGTLLDYNVLRGGNEQTNKAVYEILKSSSKWEPGMQNNKRVNVQYTIVLRNNDIHSK